MDTRIEHREEFIVRIVPSGRHRAWYSGFWPIRYVLAVTACFVALSGFAQLQWRHTYGETNSEPESGLYRAAPRAVAFDRAENIFVAVTSYGPARITLLKLSPGGELLWARDFNGLRFSGVRAVSLAVDGDGNAYVLGGSATGIGEALVVLKFDPDGDLLWTATYDYPGGEEWPAAIALDAQANVYVTGVVEGFHDARARNVAFTVKFDANGEQLWSAIYRGRRGYAGGAALDVDAFGNVYITGGSDGDVLTVKYDASGRQIWARRHNGTPGLGDGGLAIVVGPLGEVHVAGVSYARAPGGRQDWVTLKYSSTGQLRWAKRRNGGVTTGGATALVRDNEGSVYVTGRGAVIKYTSAGRKVWETALAGRPFYIGDTVGLRLDERGFLYYTLTESFGGFDGRYIRVGQIEAESGERLWTSLSADDPEPPLYEYVLAMALAPSGALVVSGVSAPLGREEYDAATVKFQPPDHHDTNRVNVTAVAPIAIEGGAAGAFSVWRTGPTNAPLVVGFRATGTARPGIDYLRPALPGAFGLVTIPAGSTNALISIQPVNDRVLERTETVRFTLYRDNAGLGRYFLGPEREAVVKILDNEW